MRCRHCLRLLSEVTPTKLDTKKGWGAHGGDGSAAICLNPSPIAAQGFQEQAVMEAIMPPARVSDAQAASFAASSLATESGISATSPAASVGTPSFSARSLGQEEASRGGGNKGAGKDKAKSSRAQSPGSAAPTGRPARRIESLARQHRRRQDLGGSGRGPAPGRSLALAPLLPILDEAPRVLGIVRSPGRLGGRPILPTSDEDVGRSRSPLLRRMGGRFSGVEDLTTDSDE
jgi:hypothetical protein